MRNVTTLGSLAMTLLLMQAPSVWNQLGNGTPNSTGMLPTGAIIFVSSGSCPSYWTEQSLAGNYILLTTHGNGDAGTTGGSTSYTPAGTNATAAFTPTGTNATAAFTPSGTLAWPAGVPTFAGSAGTVPAQTFTGSSATTSAVSAGTPAGTNGTASVATVTGSKAGSSAGAFSTIGGASPGSSFTVPAETFTGSALATHAHTLTATGTNGTAAFTPAGTVAWPAGVPTFSGSGGTVPAQIFTGNAGTVPAQVFSGTQATIQPTFIKLIACMKS